MPAGSRRGGPAPGEPSRPAPRRCPPAGPDPACETPARPRCVAQRELACEPDSVVADWTGPRDQRGPLDETGPTTCGRIDGRHSSTRPPPPPSNQPRYADTAGDDPPASKERYGALEPPGEREVVRQLHTHPGGSSAGGPCQQRPWLEQLGNDGADRDAEASGQ